MPTPEMNRQKIIQRLEAEGWVNEGGGKHDLFWNPAKSKFPINVPRHRTLSVGVARQIGKAAGW